MGQTILALIGAVYERVGLQDDALWRKHVLRFFLVALALHLMAGWRSDGSLNPDEHFQVIEFANVKLGGVSAAEMPWEMSAKARPWLQPALVWCVFRAAQMVGVTSPVLLAKVAHEASGLCALAAAYAFVLALYGALRTMRARLTMLSLSTLFCVFPWLHVRTSSENASGSMMLIAFAAIYLALSLEMAGLWSLVGLSLGAAIHFRYQVGFMVLGSAAWCLFIGKLRRAQWAWLAVGFVVANVVAILVDGWGWGEFVNTPWNYLRTQVLEGRANEFGVSPWWSFVPLFWREFPQPFGALAIVVILGGMARAPKSLVTWACAPFLAMHILFGHKEARFLIPVLYCAPYFAAQWPWPKMTPVRRIAMSVVILLNLGYLVRDVLRPLAPGLEFLEPIYNDQGPRPVYFLWEGENPFMDGPLFRHFYNPGRLEVREKTARVTLPSGTPYFWYRRIKLGELLGQDLASADRMMPRDCKVERQSTVLSSVTAAKLKEYAQRADWLASVEVRQTLRCAGRDL